MNDKEKEKKEIQHVIFKPDKLLPQNDDIEKFVLGNVLALESAMPIFMRTIKGENVFYNPIHRTIFESINRLYQEGKDIDILTITDDLHKTKELDSVGGPYYITHLTVYATGGFALEHHIYCLIEKHILRFLITLFTESINDCYDEKDMFLIIDNLHLKLDELEKFFESDNSKTMHEALDMFMMSIVDKSSGKVKNYYKTGYEEFDNVIALRPRMILLIGGTEGCGKSKYARFIAKGLLRNNENLALLIISGEESFDEVVSDMIAEKTKLNKRQIGGINYSLNDNEVETIKKTTDALKTHNIEIYDSSVNIVKLKNLVKKFVKKHGTQCVVIVDNLGCVDAGPGMKFSSDTEKDNYVSGTIRKLRDETNVCFIVIHHLTKEADSKWSLKEGYRPRKEHLRGSKKIIDDANEALLVNNPSIYADLKYEEKEKWSKPELVKDIEFSIDGYKEFLWLLNPNGDKDTINFDPYESGWRVVENAITNKRTYDGKDITMGFLRNKYVEYLNHYKKVNEQTEEKYKKPKWSVYSFVIKSMYNFSYDVDKTGRDYYLYGNSSQNEGVIDRLFLADAVKVRDGQKGTILRYLTDLEFAAFKEWNTNNI